MEMLKRMMRMDTTLSDLEGGTKSTPATNPSAPSTVLGRKPQGLSDKFKADVLNAFAKQKTSSQLSPLNAFKERGKDSNRSIDPKASSSSTREDENMPRLESEEEEHRAQAVEVERELRHQRAVYNATTYGQSYLETLNDPDVDEP